MKLTAHRSGFLKFVASGTFNTLVTYLLYLALLPVLSYQWSYTLSYVMGIALAYALYRYFVFRGSGGRYGPLWVTLIYLFQYLLGLALVNFWVMVLDAPPSWAPAFVIMISTPLSYMLNRWVFRADKNPDSAQSRDRHHDE